MEVTILGKRAFGMLLLHFYTRLLLVEYVYVLLEPLTFVWVVKIKQSHNLERQIVIIIHWVAICINGRWSERLIALLRLWCVLRRLWSILMTLLSVVRLNLVTHDRREVFLYSVLFVTATLESKGNLYYVTFIEVVKDSSVLTSELQLRVVLELLTSVLIIARAVQYEGAL